MKQITVAVLGAGSRGSIYASYAKRYPQELKVVAVAEPSIERRKIFSREHSIVDNMQFKDWRDLLSEEKIADTVFICTQDQDHIDPAIRALELGYDILLEKPIAPSLKECQRLYDAYKKYNHSVAVAHVLRYTPFFKTLKDLLDGGAIGKICGVEHTENVGHIHYSHSFVRGNWNNRDTSSPMILAKSCHDMDLLYFLIGEKCRKVSSFGSRSVFLSENRPEGAPLFCLDGCPHRTTCPYFAPKIYLTGNTSWPVNVLTTDLSSEGIIKALKNSPYGRCVYACDNNVIEHQVSNLLFDKGIPATFTMTAFTDKTFRNIRIFGETGEIRGYMEDNLISVFDFKTKNTSEVRIDNPVAGHGGGDFGFIQDFLIHLNDKTQDLSTSLDKAFHSHLMAFKVDEARRSAEVLDID